MGTSDEAKLREKSRESWFQSRIDIFQMIQNTLQQLMALSSAGLVLFFSFIGDAEFLKSETCGLALILPWLGIIAVWCWVAALISAAYGHFIINLMVKDIHDLTKAFNLHAADEKAILIKVDEIEGALTKLNNSIKAANVEQEELMSSMEAENSESRQEKLNHIEKCVEFIKNEMATLNKAHEAVKTFTNEITARLETAYTHWEENFLPKQKKAGWVVLFSLSSMATGLIILATAYTIWVLTH